MEIDGTELSPDSVYVIAEAGVNHDGDVAVAKALIEVAADAGADAVKFQTFDSDRLVTAEAEKADYAKETTDAEESQREMLRRYELTRDDHRRLQSYAADCGVTFLSTPFDGESATFLDELDVPAIKLGSGELTNKPLIEHVTRFGRPMIVSTGMATMGEVRTAHDWIRAVDPDADVAFLHCTSAYPAEMTDVNLRAMQSMRAELPTPVGYSDHTTSTYTPGLAVAAGAAIVEKHFTLDSTREGPDHEASLEPEQLATAVDVIRDASNALGRHEKTPTAEEEANKLDIRKSIHATTRISAGESFTEENTAILRPANGRAPAQWEATLGQVAATDLAAGDPVTDTCVANGGS